MSYKMVLLYDEKTRENALDTFEDIQSELAAWKIAHKASNGKAKKIVTEQAEVSCVFYEEGVQLPVSDVVYTTDRLKKKVKSEQLELETKFITHSKPIQDMVNIVIEIKNLYDAQATKEEEKKQELVEV